MRAFARTRQPAGRWGVAACLALAIIAGCSDGGSTGFDVSAQQAAEQREVDRVAGGRACGSFEDVKLCGADERPMTSRPVLSDPVRMAPDSGGVLLCRGDSRQCVARVVFSGGVLANGDQIAPRRAVRLAVGPVDPPNGWFAGQAVTYAAEGFKAGAQLEITLARSAQLPLDSGTQVRIAVLVSAGDAPPGPAQADLLRDFDADTAVVASPLTLEVQQEPGGEGVSPTPTTIPTPAAPQATPVTTVTPGSTPTSTPTNTLAPTPTGTSTRSFTPSASPAEAQVEIEIPPVVVSADGTARVDVVLRSNGANVAGMQNDLLFDNTVLKIDPQFGCRINEAISDRLPECTDSDTPTLPCKTLSRHLGPCDTVGPLGSCPAPDPALSRFRALIFAIGVLNSNTIPDGSVLYTCVFDVVDPSHLPALIVNTSVVASDPSGVRLPASGRNGAVLGSAEQAPPPTWTRHPPTATPSPTPTRTPTSTPAPGTPSPSRTQTIMLTRTASPTQTHSPTPLPTVVIRITSAEPAPDGTVTVDIVLESAGDFVSRTQNDILFDGSVLRLPGASSCRINPEISDEQPNCNLDRQSLRLPCKTLIRELAPCSRDPLPDGCPEDAPGLERLRARVSSVTTGEATIIPGGSILYRCTFEVVAPDRLPALLKVANAAAVSRVGIDAPTLGADGSVFAAGRPTPAPTWTIQLPPPSSMHSPSATPTPTRAPTATPTPPAPATATGTLMQTATRSETPIAGTSFMAVLTDEQEVPPVKSGDSGEATFVLSTNETALAFELKIVGHGAAALKQAHIRVAPRGFNGPIVLSLAQDSFQSPLRGTLTEADLGPNANVGVNTFTDFVAALKAGDAHVNVTTSPYETGSVRGQIRGPTTFVAHLSGGQELPPVATSASGEATFTLSADETSLTFELNVANLPLATISLPHIHVAPRGFNGPMVLVLPRAQFQGPWGGTLSAADLIPSDMVAIATFADVVAALKAGDAYVEVSTHANPTGEIRGQIQAPLEIAATLSGEQEVPPVNSPDNGRALLLVNSERTALRLAFEARVAVMRCPNMRVRIHVAPPGANGPMVFNLAGDPVTGFLRWQLSAADLIAAPESGIATLADFIAALEAGDVYVNMISGLNPEGEIRGQLRSPALELVRTRRAPSRERGSVTRGSALAVSANGGTVPSREASS